tara:strand:+ start:940 stop:1734 length:795 start_codon:yes stop_codon:yes gene_type:complete
MKKRIIKQKEHIVYDNIGELRQVMPNEQVYDDWRTAPVFAWTLTDDEQVCQILEKGKLNNHNYVRTAIGMFLCVSSVKIEGPLRENIYTFSGKNVNTIFKERDKLTKQEFLFGKYIAKGEGVIEAFKHAYPKANSNTYIKEQSSMLLKTERIQTLIDKEIEKILDETEISPKYLLLKTKEIVDNEEARDSDKIASLKMLMEISGLLGKKEQKTESIALFKGFSPEQLELLEGKNVKKIASQEREVHRLPTVQQDSANQEDETEV